MQSINLAAVKKNSSKQGNRISGSKSLMGICLSVKQFAVLDSGLSSTRKVGSVFVVITKGSQIVFSTINCTSQPSKSAF